MNAGLSFWNLDLEPAIASGSNGLDSVGTQVCPWKSYAASRHFRDLRRCLPGRRNLTQRCPPRSQRYTEPVRLASLSPNFPVVTLDLGWSWELQASTTNRHCVSVMILQPDNHATANGHRSTVPYSQNASRSSKPSRLRSKGQPRTGRLAPRHLAIRLCIGDALRIDELWHTAQGWGDHRA